jgi:uncharacterized protein (TIGR02058 family)
MFLPENLQPGKCSDVNWDFTACLPVRWFEVHIGPKKWSELTVINAEGEVMALKRFIVEIGTGIDLHGENMTEASCRAVKDAISRSCLCGLVEILGHEKLDDVDVDILVACPKPEEVDLEKVKSMAPVGRKKAQAISGGMTASGLCVPRFAEKCDRIVVANAAVTVSINVEK